MGKGERGKGNGDIGKDGHRDGVKKGIMDRNGNGKREREREWVIKLKEKGGCKVATWRKELSLGYDWQRKGKVERKKGEKR